MYLYLLSFTEPLVLNRNYATIGNTIKTKLQQTLKSILKFIISFYYYTACINLRVKQLSVMGLQSNHLRNSSNLYSQCYKLSALTNQQPHQQKLCHILFFSDLEAYNVKISSFARFHPKCKLQLHQMPNVALYIISVYKSNPSKICPAKVAVTDLNIGRYLL